MSWLRLVSVSCLFIMVTIICISGKTWKTLGKKMTAESVNLNTNTRLRLLEYGIKAYDESAVQNVLWVIGAIDGYWFVGMFDTEDSVYLTDIDKFESAEKAFQYWSGDL